VVRRLLVLARATVSPLAIISLAAPLAGVALLAMAGWVEWAAALEARSARAWAVAAALALLSSLVLAAVERQLAPALARAAVALAALQLLAAWAYRVDGTIDAGEGEQWPAWRTLSFGPAGRPPDTRLVELPEDPGGTARVEIDGREVEVPVGREVRVEGGLAVRVRAPFGAPSFEVRRASGVLESAGLLKLVPGERTWFEAAFLPHRFYVTLTADGPAGARVRLRVQRGKVRLLDREVAPGEQVDVEGISVTLGPGARWSPIDVRRRSPLWPGLSALVLAVAAGAAAWRKGRSET
jgi:hypothetical protein